MFLGLDIGTSSVKAALVEDDRTVAEASAPLTLSAPHPGWSEQAPEDWWNAAVAAVRRLPDRGGVRGVGLSGQMHGAVLLDSADRAIRPAMLWNDGRAADEAERLAAIPGIAEVAGVRPLPGLTAPKLLWLRRAEPEAYGRIRHVLSVKDWLGLRLHGGHFTDTSDAAGTLWFDQAARGWSDDLARQGGVDPAWLPPVLHGWDQAGTLRPQAAADLGLPPGIPVFAGAGDTVAGAVGIGAVEPGNGFLGIGTSGQIVTLDDAYRPMPPDRMIHSFAFTLPGRWYRMAAMLNGARPLAWFASVAGRPVAELLAEAQAAGPERAPLFLPYLTGERTPHGDPSIRGGFLGLSDSTGAAQMMRGVIEAVAYSFADAAQALGALPEAPLAVGGGAASDLLLQTMADVLGVPILRPGEAGTGAARGAARLAACGAGAMTLSDLAIAPDISARFEPDANAAPRHAERLARFRAFYLAVKGL